MPKLDGKGEAKLIVHGWFFGIRRHRQCLYLIENCAVRDRHTPLGRLLRLDLDGQRIVGASAFQFISRCWISDCRGSAPGFNRLELHP